LTTEKSDRWAGGEEGFHADGDSTRQRRFKTRGTRKRERDRVKMMRQGMVLEAAGASRRLTSRR
jgi:hypothetical protein